MAAGDARWACGACAPGPGMRRAGSAEEAAQWSAGRAACLRHRPVAPASRARPAAEPRLPRPASCPPRSALSGDDSFLVQAEGDEEFFADAPAPAPGGDETLPLATRTVNSGWLLDQPAAAPLPDRL